MGRGGRAAHGGHIHMQHIERHCLLGVQVGERASERGSGLADGRGELKRCDGEEGAGDTKVGRGTTEGAREKRTAVGGTHEAKAGAAVSQYSWLGTQNSPFLSLPPCSARRRRQRRALLPRRRPTCAAHLPSLHGSNQPAASRQPAGLNQRPLVVGSSSKASAAAATVQPAGRYTAASRPAPVAFPTCLARTAGGRSMVEREREGRASDPKHRHRRRRRRRSPCRWLRALRRRSLAHRRFLLPRVLWARAPLPPRLLA